MSSSDSSSGSSFFFSSLAGAASVLAGAAAAGALKVQNINIIFYIGLLITLKKIFSSKNVIKQLRLY